MANVLIKSNYGSTIVLTIKDQDGAVVDVSGASAKTITFRKPDGSSVTKNLSFTTDGSDGKVEYTFQTGVLDTVGLWQYEVTITLPSGPFTSQPLGFRVASSV